MAMRNDTILSANLLKANCLIVQPLHCSVHSVLRRTGTSSLAQLTDRLVTDTCIKSLSDIEVLHYCHSIGFRCGAFFWMITTSVSL